MTRMKPSKQGEMQYLHQIHSGHSQKQLLLVNVTKCKLKQIQNDFFSSCLYQKNMYKSTSFHLVFKLICTDVSNFCYSTALRTLGATTFNRSFNCVTILCTKIKTINQSAKDTTNSVAEHMQSIHTLLICYLQFSNHKVQ